MFASHTRQRSCLSFEISGVLHERGVLVFRDAVANLVKGMRLAEMPDFSCTAHTLQLVNDGISSQRAVGDIIAKLRTCAALFNHFVQAKTTSGGQRIRAWHSKAWHHSSCACPLEHHSAHVPKDVGADACPECLCRETCENFMPKC